MNKKKFQIFLKGKDQTDNVESYIAIGDKYQITFNNGKSFNYNRNHVQVIDSVLKQSKPYECFEYLKRLATLKGNIAPKNEEETSFNILIDNYSKIHFIPPESVFGAFLSGKYPLGGQTSPSNQNVPIYPFGFNISQKDAVEKALTNSLSIIEGPPGTGKTQTILNIIANAVIRGESVAIVSSNNAATKNVYDKLKKHGFEFIAAYLGNTDNKSNFISNQSKLVDLTDWTLNPDKILRLKESLIQNYEELQKKLNDQQTLSRLKQQLSEVETEQKYFLQQPFQAELDVFQKVASSNEALDLWLFCENIFNLKENIFVKFTKRLLEALRLLGKKELLIRKAAKLYSLETLVTELQKRFYELKISELQASINKLNDSLEAFDFQTKMKEYMGNSTAIFKSQLAAKYLSQKRNEYRIDSLKTNSESFLRDYPVILSTTHSLNNCLSDEVKYDYVIVDEASQVDLTTGALVLSCAKKIVVVGDLKQLPHVVNQKDAEETDVIFSQFKLPEAYRYKNQSLLSAFIELFPNAPKTLLKEHYRCHPKIIEFCNKKFYGGQLIVLTETKGNREPLVVYKTVEGKHERNRMNQRQIDVITKEVIPQQSLCVTDGSLGIVTPYRNQTNALQKAFSGLNVKSDTVDKFQGQEKSVIILSTVDNEVSDFSDNANRLNVAISRAIDQLILVVSDNDTRTDSNIADLFQYIRYNNFTISESKIQSVFDYLYSSYGERRQKILAQHKKVSMYESENLAHYLITRVLNEKNANHLKVATHVPLKMLLKNLDLLSPEERRYANHFNTHVDFLIYDNIVKTPKLIVEVDGVRFHEEGSKQAKRDLMKNNILNKYDLDLLRLKTDGSAEAERLIQALKLG